MADWDDWDADRPTSSPDPLVHDDPTSTASCADHPEATGVPGDGVTAAPSTGLDDAVATTRLAGADRFATAAALTGARFAEADEVVLVDGTDDGSALEAAAAAARAGAPLLLTDGEEVGEATRAALSDDALDQAATAATLAR